MASKQTRRSISVRGTTYSLLRDFCAEHDRSMSDVVEELLGRIFDDGQTKAAPRSKTVAPLVARAPQRPSAEPKAAEPVARPRAVEPDRAAFRVAPLARTPEPAPVRAVAAPAAETRSEGARPAARAAEPRSEAHRAPVARPSSNGPARPVPVASAGRPAPTPAAKVKGTTRHDYRAIRF